MRVRIPRPLLRVLLDVKISNTSGRNIMVSVSGCQPDDESSILFARSMCPWSGSVVSGAGCKLVAYGSTGSIPVGHTS